MASNSLKLDQVFINYKIENIIFFIIVFFLNKLKSLIFKFLLQRKQNGSDECQKEKNRFFGDKTKTKMKKKDFEIS